MEKDIVEISDKVKDDRAIDAEGILNEIEIDIRRGKKEGWKGYQTKFKGLDERTGGLLPTHCWIIGAYTGVGKTFFILQIILNILEQGAKVMFFSTEMDRKMNMLRLLANLSGVGTIRLIKGDKLEEEQEDIARADKVLRGYKDQLKIYDNVFTVEEIRLKAKKEKLKNGLNVVFIDFIQNLRGDSNIYERMSNAATALQEIAQELQVTMVITSQVAQSSAGWQSKEAIEYKGAGEIAAIADVGLWIKKNDNLDEREVFIRKIRHGAPGKFHFRLSFPSGRVIYLPKDGGEIVEEGKEVISADGSV